MNKVLAAAVLLATCAVANAQEMKEGWGFQFRQDTFDKTIFPLAMMSQEGKDLDKSLLAVACGNHGELIAFFQPGMMTFDHSAKVQFRDGENTKEFTFAANEVPNLGKYLSIDATATSEMMAIFERANGSEVAFKTGKKQGAFASIASARTFELMRQNCPKKAS